MSPQPPFELPGYTVDPDWKPGPWLSEKAQSVGMAVLRGTGEHAVVIGPKGMVLSIPLGGILTDNGSEQDMTCDKCDKVVLDGLWTFGVGYPLAPRMTLMFTGGLCQKCAEEEDALPKTKET